MPRPANPFIYGGPVPSEQFFGRENEANRIFDQLSSHARGSVALTGERRIGKTSLLHYVSASDVVKRWGLDDAGSLFIFQDCGGIAPFTITRFWQTILKRLRRALKRKKVDPDLLETIAEALAAAEITALEIEFLLDDLHEAGLFLVLMLDEFEWCVRTDAENEAMTRDFLAGLRSLINHVPRTLSLIVATRRPLDETCRDVRFMGSPFYNNFVFLHLRPFSRAESELLLIQMPAQSGIAFSEAEKAYIYDLAGTQPLLLQAAAGLIFDLKATGATEIKDFALIRRQFHEQVEHQFEDFWKWSQPKEREILSQLAYDQDDTALNRLEAWADERERLLRRGLIKSEDNTFRLFSAAFWEWLIDNLYRLEEVQPPDSPQIGHLKQQLAAHHRRLGILQNQAAKYGEIDAPAHLLMDIEDTAAKIEALEAKIAGG